MRRFILVASASLVLSLGCAVATDPFPVSSDSGRKDSGKTGLDGATPEEDGAVADSTIGVTDSAVVEDTNLADVPPTPVDAPVYDSGEAGTKPPGAGVSYDDTVGDPCTSDPSCDVTSLGVTYCSKGLFTAGSLYPQPVCVGVDCSIPDPTSIYTCDGGNGVCLAAGSSNLCLPMCEFDGASGYQPSGCAGKNVCNAYGWGKDTSGKLTGVGYCFGGCWENADCAGGESCQREDGLCTNTPVVYTKPLGTACTSADSTANACNCLYATASGKGYCTHFCKVGEVGWCPGGYTCDASLPKDDGAGSALFAKAPAGIAGYCLKNCVTDADCTAINGYCKEMAGTGQKTCQIGTP